MNENVSPLTRAGTYKLGSGSLFFLSIETVFGYEEAGRKLGALHEHEAGGAECFPGGGVQQDRQVSFRSRKRAARFTYVRVGW